MDNSCPNCSEPMEQGRSTIEGTFWNFLLFYGFSRMFLFFRGINSNRKIILMKPEWAKDSLYCSVCKLVIIQNCEKSQTVRENLKKRWELKVKNTKKEL